MADQVSDFVRVVAADHEEVATHMARMMSSRFPNQKYVALVVDDASAGMDRKMSLVGSFTKADLKLLLQRTLDAL